MSRRLLPTIAAALFSLALLAAAPSTARAVYECGGITDDCLCGMSNPCICCDDAAHGTAHGNCVWYAWHKACCVWGTGPPWWCGNAEFWDTESASSGYTVLTTACEDTIFVCEVNTSYCNSGGYGHVGWVNTVHANGSIDVEEQGCYSWYGVQTRNFNAAAAVPTMHYIYEQGVTSCQQCDCNPGAVETNNCGDCGTDSRTCAADCTWGGWTGCQNEGVCSEGATQGCGSCGGTQTCESNCQWGTCVETCPDASTPQPDAFTPTPDGATPQPDGTTPTGDSGTTPPPDGSTPNADGSTDSSMVRGGCSCQSHGGPSSTGLAWLLALALGLLWRRRRTR